MYQSFDDSVGSSNSPAKWDALKIGRLDGLAVLDLGCNAGYFCAKAKDAGATYVVGVDQDAQLIVEASSRRPDIVFECRNWDDYLQLASSASFDVVLMLSTFHYVRDRPTFLTEVHRLLRPNGYLLIEVGLVQSAMPYPVPVDRHTPNGSDRVWHLTPSGFGRLVQPLFSPRLIGESVTQPGDPIQRFSFHCAKRAPWAVLVRGMPGAGKTDLARILSDGERCVHLSIDEILMSLFFGTEAASGLIPPDLSEATLTLQQDANRLNDVVDCLIRSIPPGQQAVIIEGFALNSAKVSNAVQKALEKSSYRVASLDL